jgi:hypothetical protein
MMEFIESLHYRSWIVQIDQLKQHRRNGLEKLLSIFDQTNRSMNHHLMNVNEEDFPEMYRPIVRRLRMAAESGDIQIEMEMEDNYLKELQDKERKIAQKEKELAQAMQQLGMDLRICVSDLYQVRQSSCFKNCGRAFIYIFKNLPYLAG